MALSAPRDGLTIGHMHGEEMLTNELLQLGEPAKFESIGVFSVIAVDGSQYDEPTNLLCATPTFPFNSVAELKGYKGVLKAGTNNLFSSYAYNDKLVAEMLGLDGMKIIPGYSGVAMQATATYRGELDLVMTDEATILSYIEGGMLKVLGSWGTKRRPKRSDLPAIGQLALPGMWEKYVPILDAMNKNTRFWAAPPEIPKDRLEFLWQAFDRVLHTPDLIAEFEKRQIAELQALAVGEEVVARIDSAFSSASLRPKDLAIFRRIRADGKDLPLSMQLRCDTDTPEISPSSWTFAV